MGSVGCDASRHGEPAAREPFSSGRAAFDRAVLPERPNLRAAALRLTRNRADAEDLVQETVLRAWRFWPRYVERDTCRAWLQCILTNTFLTERRRIARRRVQLDELEAQAQIEIGDQTEALSNELERNADSHQLDDRLGRGLSLISSEHRRILFLIDVNERSYREAADELACPIGTVMSRLHRARAALRQKLGVQAVA
ncbi:MAG TPA: sigma-70 family RNA polymerase sigma factor [Polyangiales bacterium]|nr:sigma-70 family RNA polymerase sigma factor [Polyangiales bacterium]